MARPKTGRAPKRSLNLTVSETARENLDFLSSYYGESISALVSNWAAKEAGALRTSADDKPSDSSED